MLFRSHASSSCVPMAKAYFCNATCSSLNLHPAVPVRLGEEEHGENEEGREAGASTEAAHGGEALTAAPARSRENGEDQGTGLGPLNGLQSVSGTWGAGGLWAMCWETGVDRKVNYVQLAIGARNQKLFIEEAEVQAGLGGLMRFEMWIAGLEGGGAPAGYL